MSALKVTLLLLISLFTLTHCLVSDCPQSTRIQNCSPKCKDNSNCQGSQICCTNICNTQSCTDINIYLHDKNDRNNKYSSSNRGSGTYCGNLKCNSYEKCELDRSTNRYKCVRA